MHFRDIIGQDEKIEQLVRSVVDNRLAHAYLFIGPRGSGKLPLALAFAQYILCQTLTESESCGKCASCLQCDHLSHPDLHFAFPVNTTKEVTKDPISNLFLGEWRSAVEKNPYMDLSQWMGCLDIDNKQGLISVKESEDISRKMNLKAFSSDRKVLIMWLPEKLNIAAANKLLKLLEEPPPGTTFLLVSEEPEQIITTILSRVQLFRLGRLTDQNILTALQERGVEPALADQASKRASGNFNEALRLVDEIEHENYYHAEFVRWMRLCFSKNLTELVDWVQEISSIGRERQKSLFNYGTGVFRNALLKDYQPSLVPETDGPEQKFLDDFSPFVHEKNCVALVEAFEEGHRHIERNGNPKIIFLDTSLQVMALLKKKRRESVQ